MDRIMGGILRIYFPGIEKGTKHTYLLRHYHTAQSGHTEATTATTSDKRQGPKKYTGRFSAQKNAYFPFRKEHRAGIFQ